MNADATESHGEACGFVASHHDITLCLLLAVAVFMMVAMVSADADADSETFVVDDVHYKISEEEVHVIGIEPVPLYNLIIPESVTYLDKEYEVTVIENGAFYNSSNLTGFLSLPSSLEYVYSNAIYGCNNISSLKINAGLLCEGSISNCTGLKIITVGKNTTFNTGAFNNCTSVFSLEYDSSFDSNFKIMPFCNMGVTDLEITFGDNVISLTSKLFSGIINVKITDNYIGPNIEKIYENAFYGCKFINGFNEIIIGKNVSNISLKAFDDELNLKAFSVEVGNEYYCAEDGLLYSGVTTDYKLIRVPNLKEGLIGLKSGTVSISDHSFNQCDSIHSLYVPSTLETLSIDTIRNISSLESISVSSDNNVYCSIDGILCNKETKNALLYPISKLDVVYELPSSLKGLESKSIVDCAYLNKLVIGSNITYLGYESIFNCANLLEVVYDVPIIFKSFIGESGTSCGYTITFGNNSGAITPYFLQNDLNLSSINFMNSTPIVLPNSFVGCSNLKKINFNDVVESINSVSFEGCNTIEEISVPITLIASLSGCFSDVSLLNTLIISAGATGICPDISSIEKIWSAEKTTNNINLTIQDGVKTIDASLLSCCSNIAGSLILPTSIISIDEGSFKDTFLSSITFNGDSDAYSIVDGCLLSKDESILYWCPKNKESITLSQNTVRFGNYALFGCSNLNSIFTCASEIEYGVGSLDSNISALCTFYCFSVPSESSTFGKTSQNYYEYIVPLTIRYILSGGTMSSPELLFQVPSSNLTIILETPIRTEYTFVSWEDSNGHRYDSGDVVSVEEDAITFTAIWAKTNYVVFFNPNGGIGDSFSSDYTYGVQKEFPVVDYVMDRQDLLNWNTEKDGSGDSYPLDYSESMIEVCDSDSVILYAIWTDYPSIFFVTDGGTLIETITGAEGTEINDPAPPIKTGYSFAGWNPEVPDVMPAEDLICEAVWNINVYSITYQFNNGQPNLVRTYEYNSEVEVESNPSRVGYTFSNWSSEIPLVMPAYDLEITATWVANQYYVKFVGNGSTEGVMDDQIMIYDNYHSLLPVVFERTGYYFSGWAESDTGVSVYGDCQTVINLTSGDSGEEYVVLYATWEPVEYRVVFHNNGGSGDMWAIYVTYDSSDKLSDCTFTKLGHSFSGWSLSPTGDVIRLDGAVANNLSCGAEVNLYAIWSINQYTITFDTKGGSTINNVTQDYGSQIVKPGNPTREGYTFIGWSETIPDTMPAESLTIDAIWSINSYSITYILNNGSEQVIKTYEYGTEIDDVPVPLKTGYHFVSWSPNVPGTMPAHNLEVECVWSPNVHRVDFIANGGEGSMDSIELTYDTSYDLPKCIFIKEGHTFLGWSYSSNGNVVHTDGKTVKNLDTGTDPLELFAIWSINSYSITYVLNNGSEQVVKTYEYSAEIDDVPAPSKTGYHFVSWSPEIPDTMPASDLTTECIWSPNVHRVDFIANGGDGFMESIELTYDVSYDLPKCIFIKEGHTFQGWALSHDGIVVHTDGKTVKNLDTGTDPLELYAIWSINSYSITYILNNGSDPIIDIHVYSTEIDDVPAPSKTGYHFVSWSPEIPDTMPASDLTTECIWSPNVCELSFDPNGGSEEMDSIDITYDEQTTLPLCLFVKVGYSFIGWSYSADGAVVYEDGKVLINPTACTDPLTLFAKWSPNSYKVTFTPNGGVGSDINVTYTYDSDVILPKNTFTRTGHTFDGWSLTSGGPLVRGDMSAVDNLSTGDDIVLYAKWSVNSYSLTFLDTGDSVVNTIVADYGTSIICPEDPVKEGHTFLRWNPAIPVTMPAEGSSHTAIWERNTYVLTFAFDNGESNRVYEYEFAASIALTFNLLRTGYTFTGWDVPIPNTMPSRDMTITAQWSPNAYGIGYEPNGGSGVMSDSSAIYDSDIGLKQCTFERIGHTFMGWATAVSGQVRFSDGQQVSNLATGTTGDDRRVLYAIWSPNEYMVTFHSSIDNGTVTHTYTYGVDSSLPTGLFNREGHSISGWALVPDGEMVRSEGGDVNNLSTGDSVDLYALWALNRYVISFHNTGDSSIRSISGLYGSDVESPEDPVRKGYTFQGWVPKVPDRMPAKDAQINATWSINNYVIGFRDCDLDDITVEYGRILELPSPERTGYIFGGWKEGAPQAMPDSNIVLTASWVPRTMTVSFHGFEELGLTVEYDSPYGELPDAERQGYDLRGWFSDEGLTQRVTEQSVVNNCADHVLYGHFVKVWVISISTESDGRGQVFGSGTYDHGTYVSVGATPVDGYAFVRWSDGGRMAERTLVADSDISIDAVFSPLRMVMLDDGSEIDRRNVPVGEPLILPDSGCARPGYEFMGWTDGVQRYRVGSEIPMPSEDVSLEGVWRPILYTITFDDGGDKTTFRLHAGAAIPDVTVDDTVDLVFRGWDSVVPGTMPAHDLYLRSVWAAREVSYVFHDSDMQVLRLEVGSDMPEPPVPSREGHVFEGWDPIVPDVVGAEDMTFVARWSVGTFSVNYIPLNDSQMSVVNVRYGEPIPVISEPIRKGYRFTGWSPQIPELMPAEDITVRANWEAIEYKVVLDKSDGEVVIKGTYGSPVPVPHGVEVRDGYEFGGWDSDIPSTFPDHDLVISGTWVPKTFVLTLDLEEDIVMDVSCGSSIPDVQVPSKEGYRFIGWVPGIEAMPAHDVTLVPEWSVETYVVTFDMCDGNSPQNVSIPYGSEIPLPESSDGPIVCWSPTVPDRMPAHNMTFRAVFSAPCHDDGGIREFVGDGCTVVANNDGHMSGTLRIVSEDHWSMLLSTDSLDDVRGPVFATVRSTGEYGGYEVDVRTERGEIRGNVVVNIPYLGHVGDRARVSIVDMSGQHTFEAVCMEYNGRTYLSVEASPNSLCQIVEVLGDADEGFDYLYLSIPVVVTLAVLALILWRRLGQ